MVSIQTKFLVLILGCLFISSSVIGGAGILHADKAAYEKSAQTINLLCAERTQELNALLGRIEQSVRTLAVYAASQLESANRLNTDAAYLARYTNQLESVAINAASNTEGAMAVYIRFNPEFTPPTSGVFWSKTALDGRFRQLVPTDFSRFNPADVEHVGWYYIPVKNGKPTWMPPYLNKNINVRMISFVIPLYVDNQTVGVVGMDIDFSVITQIVNSMRIYRSGYAFLTDLSGNIVHHENPNQSNGGASSAGSVYFMNADMRTGTSGGALSSYSWDDEPKRLAFRRLQNDMLLMLSAPVAEIDADRDILIVELCIALFVLMGIATFLTIFMTRRLLQPLYDLNEAAKRIAAGDFSVRLIPQTKDEIGLLSESFQQTVAQLQKHISYINGLAYRDSLTGVKNKTAFDDAKVRLEEKIRTERPEFAVLVLDINGLKLVNDTYGHDFGDILLLNACRIICKSFPHSPVYRIGGDEFVVILENNDYQHYSTLLEKFQIEIDEHNRTSRADTQISIARGIGIYSSESDLTFSNVFKRADNAMYQNKANMKAKAQEEAKAKTEACKPCPEHDPPKP